MKYRTVYNSVSFLRTEGFTLVELLVATTVLSVIMAALYTSFSAGVHVWKQGEESMQTYQEVRLALQIMSREIRSISAVDGLFDTRVDLPPSEPVQKFRFPGLLGDTGEGSDRMARLRFVTYSPSLLVSQDGSTSDRLLVQYSVGTDPVSGTLRLERREVIIRDMKEDGTVVGRITEKNEGQVETQEPIVLAEDIEDLDFRYYWTEEPPATEGWLDHCRPRYYLPNAIQVTLRTKSEGFAGARSFTVVAPVGFSFRDHVVKGRRSPRELMG